MQDFTNYMKLKEAMNYAASVYNYHLSYSVLYRWAVSGVVMSENEEAFSFAEKAGTRWFVKKKEFRELMEYITAGNSIRICKKERKSNELETRGRKRKVCLTD